MRAVKKSSRVCLIIPAYNEGSVIGGVVSKLKNTFKSSGYTHHIIVVDDGSKDNTAAEAAASGAQVISHILNSGSGGATATGLSYAQQKGYDIAATLDADGQHDPTDVLKGIRLMEEGGFELLIGSRLIKNEGMSKTKRLGNKGLSLITYLLFGVNVTDSQSGLRIFSKKALNELKWKTSGYEFCSEMLWRAKQQKLRIGEYPIKAIYTDYSKAKGQNNWNALNIIKSLLRRRIVELIGE
ncbi:MAG: glycosyltransferase family 2 protein [Patescibacteria group bacterium]